MTTPPKLLKKDSAIEHIAPNVALGRPEEALLDQNKRFLTKIGVEYSTFIPTPTGLKKSILDATQPVRTHFELSDFHNYDTQLQGSDHKKTSAAYFVSGTVREKSRVSLYRPVTKKGDPRMWFTRLKDIAVAWDTVAIILHEGIPYLLNITRYNLEQLCQETESQISIFLTEHLQSQNSVANELLNKLNELAKHPLPATKKGDTAIGMAIEAALGIQPNSDKKPDYKGIELKSGRGNKTRTTLFAQVADWKLSTCKSSAQILDKYGYERGNDFKLNCTIKAQKANSQGLSFKYEENDDELHEVHQTDGHVATWTGRKLRQRLLEKHSETFFIHAKSEKIDGQEFFHLKSVTHTKAPLLNQLMPLLADGTITMDHLIKRKGDTEKVRERGPLFKINEKDLDKLFPNPTTYDLLNQG